MPEIWDDTVIVVNLKTISTLDSYRVRIRMPDVAGAIRLYDGEDSEIVNECDSWIAREGIRDLTLMFITAMTLARVPKNGVVITPHLIESAMGGLKILGRYYYQFDVLSRRDQRRYDDMLKELAEGPPSPSKRVMELREKWKAHLVFMVTQATYLGSNHGGVCQAMVWDWFRRKLVSGKDSFAISSKTSKSKVGAHRPGDSIRSLGLPIEDSVRMQRKVARRIHSFQKASGPIGSGAIDRIKVKFPQLASITEHDLSAVFGGYGPTKRRGGEADPKKAREKGYGKALFAEVLLHCVNHDINQRFGGGSGSGCYSIALRAGLKGGAHALGFHLVQDRIHFLDPNVGEFEFSLSNLDFVNFGEDLWNFYVATQEPPYFYFTLKYYELSE